jgi:hypothetical protein
MIDTESGFDCYERSLGIEHRSGYPKLNAHYRFQCRIRYHDNKTPVKIIDSEANWANDIISARVKFLVEKHPEMAEEFLLNRCLSSITLRYLRDDYTRLSPRIAKMAVYDALVQLLGSSALEGIERDPPLGWDNRRGRKKKKID